MALRVREMLPGRLNRILLIANQRATFLALGILLLLGLGLRVWGIERYGLWIDEITTAKCLEYPLDAILDCYWVQVGSPVSFVATNLLYALFGRMPLPAPEWMVRLPEVLAGTLTIVAAWLAAREGLGMRGAWFNALLWTFAPTAIAYSQEARMYAWLMLFSNLSVWLLLYTLRRNSWRGGVGYGLVGALNFYSHYLGAFILIGQWLFASAYVLFVPRRAPQQFRTQLVPIVCSVVIASALIIVWFPNILKTAQVYLLSGSYVRVALTPAYLLDAQSWIVLDMVSTPLAAVALGILELVGGWWMLRHARRTLALIGCCVGVTFVFLLWRQAGFTAMRYWNVTQTSLYLLLAAGGLGLVEVLSNLVPKRFAPVSARAAEACIALVGIVALLPALGQFYTDQFESSRFDDWRGAAQFLRLNANTDDLVLAFGEASVYHKMAFDYYLPVNSNVPRVLEPNELYGNLSAHAQTIQDRAWGIVYARDTQTVERLRALGGAQAEVYLFKNLAIVSPRPTPQETLQSSTLDLIKLYRDFDPERFAFAEAILQDTGAGKNLILNSKWETRKHGLPRQWQVNHDTTRVVSLDGEPALQENHTVGTPGVDAQQSISLAPDQLYILRFECRNTLTNGAQRVYVLFNQSVNAIFPNGGGYLCPNDAAWHVSAFAFRAPAPQATILLRNGGSGAVYWRHIALYKVSERK